MKLFKKLELKAITGKGSIYYGLKKNLWNQKANIVAISGML